MKEIKMNGVIWKRGTKLLCIVDCDNEIVQKGKIYEVDTPFVMKGHLVKLRGGILYNPKYFIKCENLSRLEAIKAMLDGYTIGCRGLVGTYVYRYDESRNTLVGRDGQNYGMNAFCRDDYHIVIPKKNTTITLANGKKVELSEESYKALEDNA